MFSCGFQSIWLISISLTFRSDAALLKEGLVVKKSALKK